MAKGIIFQTPETRLFFFLLLQATTTSLTKEGCMQLTPIKEEINAEETMPNDNE